MSMPVDPQPPAFAPRWLSPASVKDWLRINGTDTTDDDLVRIVTVAAEPHVERHRPEFMTTDVETGAQVYVPDGEAYLGAMMYAAREYRRRNSPAGIEGFGDVTSFVSRWDPDIDRSLRTGDFAPPRFA
jgi:hypothetical protein